MNFNPQNTYVYLANDGIATPVAGGSEFWSALKSESFQRHQGWLVTEFDCDADWSNWEMHPNGDEFVYLLSGSIDLLLEQPTGVQSIELRNSGATLVPRGIWHTAKVHESSECCISRWAKALKVDLYEFWCCGSSHKLLGEIIISRG
jgi:mannose-6-phosphate isomerase-like protein (cupin superfamily)